MTQNPSNPAQGAPAPAPQPYAQQPYQQPYPQQAYPMGGPQPPVYDPRDTGSFGWAVLGFFIPLAGLVLWLVWRPTRPRDSIMSRNGFIAGVILNVIAAIGYVALFASALGNQ